MLGLGQVAQPMRTEIPERHTVRSGLLDQSVCGRRDEDLLAVPRGRDPRGTMDIHTDVAATSEDTLSGVDTDPDPDLDSVRPGVLRERTLRRGGGGHRLRG
jgi:hypothetical protein